VRADWMSIGLGVLLMIKRRKKAWIIISLAIIITIIGYGLLRATLLGTIGGYNNNPQYALVQDDDFEQHRQDFETVKNVVLRYQDELLKNDEYIELYNGEEVGMWTYSASRQFAKGKTKISLSIEELKCVENLRSLDLYKGQGVDAIQLGKEWIDFDCGSETSRITNYVSYMVKDENPRTLYDGKTSHIHVKKFAPHWYSVVDGNI
jgi:hypothetical protein